MLGINFKAFNFFRRKTGAELIGVDLSENNLKLVSARILVGKIEVVNLIRKDIAGLSDTDIARALNSAYQELKAETRDIISVIPAHQIITKNIEIPSINPKEIREIISLQAGRHTPYSREEVAVDYINIGSYRSSYTKILLVIVTRQAIDKNSNILDRAGLRLERVSLAPEGIASQASKILKLDTQNAPVILVHIDEGFTDFIVLLKNKPLFIRSIPVGAQHLISEKERYLIKFGDEIKKSFEAYQSEDIERTPSSLVLTGAMQGLDGVEASLNDALHLPVKVAHYLDSAVISDKVPKVGPHTKGLSFLNVISCLAAFHEPSVNLIPEKIKLRKELEERGRNLIRTGILVLTLFVIISALLISKIYFKSIYLGKIAGKYDALAKETQELEGDFTKITQVRDYLSNRGYPLEVLKEIYAFIPLDIEINYIKYDEQGKISIRGTGDSMAVIFSFVDTMGKSKYFKDVKTRYTTKRKEGVKDLTDFEIACLVNKGSQ